MTPFPGPLPDVMPKGPYQGLSDPRWPIRLAMMKKDPQYEWKTPIEFYGKVLDQDGTPVPGATIRYGWNDVEGSHEQYMASDTTGRIVIEGLHGKRLTIDVSKEGYHAVNHGRGSFEYAAFFEPIYIKPNPNDPVIFRLIKRLEAEPLIVGRAYNQLYYDQGAYYYDLERGQIRHSPPAGSGLKVTIERGESAQGQPFDWTWRVEGVNAAVRPTDEEFPQFAPEGGYAAQWETSQSAKAEKFQQSPKTRLYVRTDDGRYAVADMELSQPNRREAGPRVVVYSRLNPSGSRNLEYDPAKTVRNP